jgi:4-amino-4-deoxy-L-arabinose transferase-like glycosyltransferase
MFDIFSIIKFIKSKITLKDCLLIGILLVLFFATRLINLDKFPIFTDEGIYIHWAKLAWHDASWRFVSLTDGRQPLQTWGTIPFLKLFPNNALLGGRLFAVTTGLGAMMGLFTLLYYLFGKKAAFIGSFIYIFTPYFLFYDRLALMDSGVNTAFIWILFFSIILIKNLRLDIAILFGITAGISLLAKSSSQLFLGLSAIAPILIIDKKILSWLRKSLNYIILLGLVVVFAFGIYNVQRLSPYINYISSKNTTFIYTLSELIKNPMASFPFNLYSIPYYILMESGFFLPIIGLIGWLMLIKNNWRLGLYLTFWTIFPFIIICFVARVMYPRYIIFFATLFTIYLTYLTVLLAQKKKSMIVIVLSLFFLSVSYFNYTILFDYKNIPLPEIDRGQYITGGSNGYGIKEIVDYARNIAKEKPVRILAEGSFGMSGDVLDVFLRPNDNIEVKSYWPLTEKDILDNQKDLNDKTILVLYVYKKDSELPINLSIKLVKKYVKPEGQSAFNLFELIK